MRSALLIIDMINTLDFPGSEKLLRQAFPVARNILKLKKEFTQQKRPVIYVNDNFGNWNANWEEVYDKCADPGEKGSKLSRLLKPGKSDYFVLKPKHSGFYSTSLEVLLHELKVDSLVLTGIAGNICVLFTANDAYMRGYKIRVPANCIASNTKTLNDFVLKQLSEVLSIDTRPV